MHPPHRHKALRQIRPPTYLPIIICTGQISSSTPFNLTEGATGDPCDGTFVHPTPLDVPGQRDHPHKSLGYHRILGDPHHSPLGSASRKVPCGRLRDKWGFQRRAGGRGDGREVM